MTFHSIIAGLLHFIFTPVDLLPLAWVTYKWLEESVEDL